MGTARRKSLDRILAIAVSIMLVLSMIPMHLLASYAADEPGTATSLTFVVTEDDGTTPIGEAKVTVTVAAEGEGDPSSFEGITDEYGIATIKDYTDAVDAGTVELGEIQYTVEKDKYVTVTGTVTLVSKTDTISVKMSLPEIPADEYTVTGYDNIYDGQEHGITVDAQECTVKYGTTETDINSNDSPKWSNVGEYTVWFRISKTGYKDMVEKAIVKINPANRNFKFETEIPEDLQYADPNIAPTFTNVASAPAEQDPDVVTYESSDSNIATVDETSGKVTFKKQGVVTITATMEENGNYGESTASYNITAVGLDRTAFYFDTTNPMVTYGANNNKYLQEVTLNPEDGDVTYEIIGQSRDGEDLLDADGELKQDAEAVAEINSVTGELTIKAAGAVKVKATVDGKAYKNAEAEYELTINCAEQSDFAFDEPLVQIVYGETGTFKTKGGLGTGEVTYEITSGAAYAEIDPDSPTGTAVVKATKAGGEVTITATKAGDNCYNASDPKNYSFKTIKAKQEGFKLLNVPETIEYGAVLDFTVGAEGGQTDGAVTYTVTQIGEEGTEIPTKLAKVEGNKIILNTTGLIGEFIVTAVKAGDVNYEDVDAKKTVKVSDFEPKKEMYSISGDKLIESGEWYTGDVTITPATGYKISYSNSSEGNTWSGGLKISDEGDKDYNFFLMREIDGAISSMATENIKLDKTDPNLGGISYSKSVLETVLEGITFGFYQSDIEVTILPQDLPSNPDDKDIVASGVNSVEYKVKADAETKTIASTGFNAEGEAVFKISPQHKGSVSFTLYDNAGRSYSVSRAEVLVADTIAPVIDVTFDNNESKNTSYYDAERTATVKIKEDNFYAEDVVIMAKKTLNDGTETETRIQPTFEKDAEGKYVAVVKEFADEADYTFSVAYTDKSGNVGNAQSYSFTVDKTDPTIDVSYDNNSVLNESKFKADRIATIRIDEHNFNAADVVVTVTAKDGNGKDVTIPKYDEHVKDINNWTKAGDVYSIALTFSEEADYTFDVGYTDLAGRKDKGVSFADGTKAAAAFTIDKTAPTGAVQIGKWEEKWTNFPVGDQDNRSFHLWDKNSVTVNVSTADELSAIDYVEHFRSAEIMGLEDVKASTAWQRAELNAEGSFSYEVAPNERFVAYVHIVDKAGNDVYLSSDGIIVDSTIPAFETLKPEVTVEPNAQPVNGIYNTDVLVDVTVIDPIDGTDVYSGLKSVTYKVYNQTNAQDQQVTQEGTLFNFDVKAPQKSDLVQKYEKTAAIKVDKKKNNSNSVLVEVIAEDNSGNISTKTCAIKIDVTKPTIDVFYDNNNADSNKYFKKERTATIVVTERNFNKDDVVVTITNTDGVIPKVGSWKKTAGDGNLDNTKWTTTVTYKADGDYTFKISYKDKAGNESKTVNYGESVAATKFTIDKTRPTASVSYNNNSAKNGKYFDAPRTATVVIKEHNFNVDRVDFEQTAALNGRNITIPSASWKHKGDTHTATIAFNADGDYTFDVVITDKAGNKSKAARFGNSVAGKDFVIDKSIEKPDFGGVENGNAYKNDVIPTITLSDANYDSYEIQLLRTRMGEIDVDVTNQFMRAITERGQGATGSYDTFEKIAENDGIYTLNVKMVDKAGNEETDEITFTVNRFGSVYEYSDYLADLIKAGGQYVTKTGKNKAAITEDLVIREYNADPVTDGSLKILITRDGEAIDVDYTATPAGGGVGSSGWYEYVYTIAASNFAEDGVYKMTLTSEYATSDSASNESSSMPDNSTDEDGNQILDAMTFTVDTTAPEIRNIVNLDEPIVDADSLDVSYSIVDVGGLKAIEILVGGKSVQKITKFEDNNFSYNGKFRIEEGSGQTVQFIVTDLAGNVTDTASKNFNPEGLYVFNDVVTVSTNFFVRWYANKLAFWGSILGVIALAGASGYLVAGKRKKQEGEE